MSLTPEQLLIPRVMCIGTEVGKKNYPKSPFISGQVITMSRKTKRFPIMGENNIENWEVDIDKKGGGFDLYSITFFEEFPNLFRPMPWYEGRKPEEMPTYLKSKNNERVVKVYDYNCTIMCFRISYATSYTSLSLFIPATEADFIAYQNSKKQ